jgi:type 1 glutamine amidotransferase
MKTIGSIGLGVAGLLLAAASLSQTGNPGGAINNLLGDPNYGVCRGISPACYHNWTRPRTTEYRALLYTRTAGPRHADLGTPLAAGLNPPLAENNVVQREMQKLAAENGFALDYTEDVTQMTRLNAYQAVIFFSTSRENLDDAGKTALRQYLRAGGGFVGIHNAFGTLYNWPYYEGLLGNANYYDHGPERQADVIMVNKKDVSTRGLATRWRFTDEWYNLVPFPTQVRFLATVDEKSYGAAVTRQGGPPPGAPPGAPQFVRQISVVGENPGHGSFHPVAWCQYYDGGKSWVTTLGHDAGDFANDNSKYQGSVEFRRLIVGGIKSAMGMEPFCH